MLPSRLIEEMAFLPARLRDLRDDCAGSTDPVDPAAQTMRPFSPS